MTFANEKMLVDRLLSLLQSQSTFCGPVRVTPEFFYSRGRTDVVAVAEDENLITFEAKLTDWRTALHQAYRNTCFAHASYVVLPKKTALTATSGGSGGPLFNEQGRVTGINFAMVREFGGSNFATPVGTLSLY